MAKLINLKLPLFLHKPHLCDPLFKGSHTYKIRKISLKGAVFAECSGCGIAWNGNYKIYWIPKAVGLALMQARSDIVLKLSRIGDGYVYVY
ncbi:MAG: hypothetical protein AABZ54_08860 [Bacteroidota bacterium]